MGITWKCNLRSIIGSILITFGILLSIICNARTKCGSDIMPIMFSQVLNCHNICRTREPQNSSAGFRLVRFSVKRERPKARQRHLGWKVDDVDKWGRLSIWMRTVILPFRNVCCHVYHRYRQYSHFSLKHMITVGSRKKPGLLNMWQLTVCDVALSLRNICSG